jgi:hypothetical protein
MRCNEFDVHIDEMLSGILHPDASLHMRQCERCNSHYRARATVQNRLNRLAAAAPAGPSRQTDRAVMEAYRELQARRVRERAGQTARVLTFPGRGLPSIWASRSWWSGAVAAAVVLAIFGSTVRLWNNTPTVSAPAAANAPAKAVDQPAASPAQVARAVTHRAQRLATAVRSGVAESAARAAAAATQPQEQEPVMTAKATTARPAVVFGGGESFTSEPVTRQSAGAPAVVKLASTNARSVAQTASSTWTGYSNLMYCDPVVCNGPMQVVHIKVPVGQVNPNVGQTAGNAFVNADVVVGPDGVARAIRVAQ